MSIFERAVRLIIRATSTDTEFDIITDHLDTDVPNYRGAFRAWWVLRRWWE